MNHPHTSPDAAEIRRHLPDTLAALPIYTYPVIDSTNAEARRLDFPLDASAVLLVAGRQEAGRGRMDRSFYSPADTGLYMTLAFRTHHSAKEARGLTPAVAVAATEAIEALTELPIRIKWVNDLYLNHCKVGGILVEAMAEPEGTRFIIGIGVNLTTNAFPDGFRAPAGALCDGGVTPPSPEALAAAITARLFYFLPSGFSDGFATALPTYRSHSLLTEGQAIAIYRGTSHVAESGTVVGITEDFALLVKLSDGSVTALSDGEVSVRGV